MKNEGMKMEGEGVVPEGPNLCSPGLQSGE
jgi:hypothetical protein